MFTAFSSISATEQYFSADRSTARDTAASFSSLPVTIKCRLIWVNRRGASSRRSPREPQGWLAFADVTRNNLQGLDVSFPVGCLSAVTGISGSGKSSLAFDTIYAEGQRRYVESLSAYARQFLDMMQKPDVDHISGLSPAISIEQKTTSKNPRSTVGTVTEIYDYLRLLFARAGTPYSPATGLPIEAQQVQDMVDRVMALPEGTRAYLLAPIVRDRKGAYEKELLDLRKRGFQRVNSVFGEGVNPRMRKIREGLEVLGAPTDKLLLHGNQREQENR